MKAGKVWELTEQIEELEAKLRKSALQELSALGEAMEAYQSQLAAEAKVERAVEALGGMIDLFSADNVLRKGTHLNMEISNARTTLAKLTKECSDAKGETE